MIDPKLNEVPVNRTTTGTQNADATAADAQQAERLRRNRAGLSINDTIAGDTLLSVGSRGVDTSGVEAGAGAGSGSTITTPGVSSSPAPNIVPGARSTGTTPRATSASGRSPAGTAQSENDLPGVTGDELSTGGELSATDGSDYFEDHEVASRAYECWCERGRPEGSPEVDWHQAVADLRERRRGTTQAGTRASAANA